VVNAYVLVFGALLLLGGRAGDVRTAPRVPDRHRPVRTLVAGRRAGARGARRPRYDRAAWESSFNGLDHRYSAWDPR